jgi:predicted RNase H-like HicB family nuclease
VGIFGGIYDMSEVIFLVEESPEGGYTARAAGHSIFTEGDTLDELRNNIREAVDCHFDDGQAPKVIRLHIVREEILPA